MTRISRMQRTEMIRKYGYLAVSRAMAQDDLAQFSLRGKEGFIGYMAKGQVLLVPGEPVCDISDARAFFSGFLELARSRGNSVCFFGCSRRTSPYARQAGYDVVKIGEEAVIDIPGFSLSGNKKLNLRRGMNHTKNVGLRVEEYKAEHERDPGLERELETISRLWLKDKKAPELGFLLGHLEIDRLEGRRVFIAKGEERVEAFLVLNPIPTQNGWYTDIMRRRPDAPNGVNERLIIEAIFDLRKKGAKKLFLGMVPFMGIDTRSKRNKSWNLLMAHMKGRCDFLYPIDSEAFFKQKFGPQWQDVYMFVHPALTATMIRYIMGAFIPGGITGLIKHKLLT